VGTILQRSECVSETMMGNRRVASFLFVLPIKLGIAVQLATVLQSKQIKLNIRILKTVQTSTGRVLQLEGGASFLEAFMKAYCDEIKKFKAPGMQCAVVLVVDNDSEGEKICAAIRKLTKKSVTKTGPYVHIAGNLYMVLTPLKAEATKSTIEDCFAEEIKNLKIGGKAFNRDNNADSSLYFGKHILSQHVRENAAKIDFAGFAVLLDSITAAIEAHQNKQAVVAAQGANVAVSTP